MGKLPTANINVWSIGRVIRGLAKKVGALLTLGLLHHSTAAAPWISPGDEASRHHLQTLVDSGLVDTTVTAWPLMWSHIRQALDSIQPSSLNEAQLWSYRYLRHELREAMQNTAFELRGTTGNSAVALGNFGTDHRERHEASLGFGYTGDNTGLQLQATYTYEPEDGENWRYDGSHLSRLWGNWVLGVGAIDRWWGPGWESSLILSHNARPAPGVFLQRHTSEPFATPWLSWLGPWQLVTFMSQLEAERDYPHARLWGMRLNFKPLDSLDIGLSRTAIWDGEGRPGGLDTFMDLLLGQDNRGGSGIEADGSNEPGNQLAGVDLRWSYALGGASGSVYGQMIGEDEAGGTPSRFIGMGGIEVQTLWRQTHLRFSLETQNTTVYFYESEKRAPNVAYEHTIYNSGYRHLHRPIGASSDNDSETYTLRGQLHFREGSRLNVSLSKLHLNRDGTDVAPPGGSVFASQDTEQLQLSYTRPVGLHTLLELGLFHYGDATYYANQKIDSGGYLTVNFRW